MNENDPIQVAFVVDENYVQHLGVAMMSLLFNLNPDVSVNFIVIGDNLSAKSISRLKQIAKEKNKAIFFPEIDFQYFAKLSIKGHYSRAGYACLALTEIIEEDKVLYLDSDLLVRCDITTLWKINITEFYSGAVIDPVINIQDDHRTRLGIPSGAPYFNSGVMLLNLKKCRQDNVMEKAFSFKLRNPDTRYHDQDGLNVAMCNNFLTIHPRWNVQSYMFNIFYNGKSRKKYPYEIIDAVKRPAIVHFTSKDKPWHYQCENPFADEYYKYLSLTPWKDYKPTGWTFRSMIRKIRRLSKRRLKSAILGYQIKGNSVF